ncbi:MAG: toxin-antitoxin system YwqK family antitoxin [Putridiphycobacter sp.]
MKNLIIIAFGSFIIACQNETQENKQLESKSVETSTTKPQEQPSTEIIGNNPNGEYLELYPNGNIKIEGRNKNGLREGTWYSYFENGNKWSETTYKNGVKSGPTEVHYPNGKVHYLGQYENDKKAGRWSFYNEDGSLEKQENY